MLASGAHVSIDGIELILSRGDDNQLQYNDHFESLFASASAIAGEIAKDQIRPEKLLWAITDWSGGEGNLIYYPQDPTTYDIGSLVNVTTRGKLTTRTERRRSAVARAGSNADTGKRPGGVSAYATALIGWEDNIIASTDAISWSAAQDTTPDMSAQNVQDVITDGTNAAFLYGGSAILDVPVVSADASVTTWADTHTGALIAAPVGAVLDGVPYVLSPGTIGSTPLVLYKKAAVMDSAADWRATTIYTLGIVPVGTWGTDWWTSMVAAETALYFSYATKTQSYIWEVRNDVGRPFYTGEPGFAIKKLIYKAGILFAIGNSEASGKKFAGIYAIPLSTRSPVFIAAPRKHKNTELDSFSIGCAGPGSTIFVADEDSGKIFLYDIERDSLSLFDDLANGGTGDGTDFVADDDKLAFLTLHGTRLFGATWSPGESGTSLQVISWDDLEPANRDDSQAISATLETAEWDFGLPMELKGLVGFYVTYEITDAATTSGLIANSRIAVAYSLDGAAYVTAATMTSATTPVGAKGRHFIQVSDGTTTKKFTRLKVKITLDNNSQAVAPPILYGVTVEAQPLAYARVWDLIVQVQDEENNDRPTSRQNSGSYIHEQLLTLATNKDFVTFVDGAWSAIPNETETYTVVVEDPSSTLGDSIGNGQMRIRLRSVLS